MRTREGEQYTRAPAVVLAGRLFPPPSLLRPPRSLRFSLRFPFSLSPSLSIYSLSSRTKILTGSRCSTR